MVTATAECAVVFPGFSESQFEFLVTHELSNLWHRYLIDPPDLTTNREEARLGYDVGLNLSGSVLLIQFKLSERLVGKDSKEFLNGFNHRPYYRIKIVNTAPSYQYDRLCDTVAQTNSAAGKAVAAWYVAPRFMDGVWTRVPRSKVHAHSRAWLGRHFKNTTLLQHLLVEDPLQLTGITPGHNHVLAICAACGKRAVCSEPEFLEEPYSFHEFVPEGFVATARNQLEPVELRTVLEALVQVAREAMPRVTPPARNQDVQYLSDAELVRAARNLMARRYGVRMFVLSSEPLD